MAAPSAGRVRVGLISDTHGALRPEAAAFLRGCDLIVHAGDICDASTLDRVRAIAPTVAVRGNNDSGAWAGALREVETVDVAGVRIMAIHDIARLGADLEAEGVDALVHGHTHKPSIESRGRTLVVNPGSAGPRRFSLPISIGELVIEGGAVSARWVDLKPRAAADPAIRV